MENHLTEQEFTRLMQKRQSGKAHIQVPRDIARNFFTRVESHSVKATTGKSITFKKLLVWVGIVASPLIFALALGLVFLSFGGAYATLVISFAGICWIIIYGFTSHHGGWLVGIIPLACSIAFLTTGYSISEPLFLYVLSLFLQRATYLLSRNWLENIVSSSYEAYEMMVDHISIAITE